MPRLEKGRYLHCLETVTGNNLTGGLQLSEEQIRVDLYSYTGTFLIKAEQPVYLISESGQVVSFHDNVDNGIGATQGHERTIYRQGIIANVAVLGHEQWTDTCAVKKVNSAVKHAMYILRHRDKVESLGHALTSETDFGIFEDVATGMVLRARYGAVYGMEFEAPKELWPIFEIEFLERKDISTYIKCVSNYVQFLSFCLGFKLKPHDIRIDRLTSCEIMAARETRTYLGDYEVVYVWPEEEIASHDLWVGGSPVRAWDEDELTVLRACLVAWMNRADIWNRSYVMMMRSFALKNVMSTERLLNACRWFEVIPIAAVKNALSADDVKGIAGAAMQKAKEQGHNASVCERIVNAVKWVKVESLEERLTRLLGEIKDKFGSGIVQENALSHLKRAIQFRGKAAHDHFNPESDEEFRAFSISTRAMEAFCYLLTALELPISAEGLERVRHNPLVQDYLRSYE